MHSALLYRAAAHKGHAACVQLLLDSGVDANQEEVMCLAARGGHVSVVQVLMSAGGVPLWLPLLAATSACCLLRSGVPVANIDVCVAASNGHVAVLQAFIVSGGVDVHAEDELALASASEWSSQVLCHRT